MKQTSTKSVKIPINQGETATRKMMSSTEDEDIKEAEDASERMDADYDPVPFVRHPEESAVTGAHKPGVSGWQFPQETSAHTPL
jgi:hypothetical protein